MEPRSPDFAFNDQLLDQYDDDELQQIIIKSRQEYMEQEKQRQEKEKQKLGLKKKLAIPVSRLTLWKNTTLKEEEKRCLGHILNILYIKTHPDRDDDDINTPDECVEELKSFIDRFIRPSRLYQDVYTVCMDCLID